jgi:hypothetical protein
MAFNAQNGTIPRVAWIIFFAGIIWAAIYDTMYAMVDRDDDLKIGIKSSAIVFGDMDKMIIGMLQGLMLFCAVPGRNQHGVRLLVQRRPGGRRGVLRLPAMADPRAQARRLLQGLPQQSLRGLRDLHRHLPGVRVSRAWQSADQRGASIFSTTSQSTNCCGQADTGPVFDARNPKP